MSDEQIRALQKEVAELRAKVAQLEADLPRRVIMTVEDARARMMVRA